MGANGFYQIGWSDSHRRDIRLEVEGSISAPMVRIVRYLPNGEITFLTLLLGEAARLYNALGQFLGSQHQCQKQYTEPDKSNWLDIVAEDPDDDPLGSD